MTHDAAMMLSILLCEMDDAMLLALRNGTQLNVQRMIEQGPCASQAGHDLLLADRRALVARLNREIDKRENSAAATAAIEVQF